MKPCPTLSLLEHVKWYILSKFFAITQCNKRWQREIKYVIGSIASENVLGELLDILFRVYIVNLHSNLHASQFVSRTISYSIVQLTMIRQLVHAIPEKYGNENSFRLCKEETQKGPCCTLEITLPHRRSQIWTNPIPPFAICWLQSFEFQHFNGY